MRPLETLTKWCGTTRIGWGYFLQGLQHSHLTLPFSRFIPCFGYVGSDCKKWNFAWILLNHLLFCFHMGTTEHKEDRNLSRPPATLCAEWTIVQDAMKLEGSVHVVSSGKKSICLCSKWLQVTKWSAFSVSASVVPVSLPGVFKFQLLDLEDEWMGQSAVRIHCLHWRELFCQVTWLAISLWMLTASQLSIPGPINLVMGPHGSKQADQ